MNLEVEGNVHFKSELEFIGANQLKKQILVVQTDGEFSQKIPIDFIKDKTDLLNNIQVGQKVKVSVNIRGNEYVDKQGNTRFGLNFQGWRIE